ncbi:MAG: hypothetical protein IT383_26405 [Deltaproteobacteria bacterium]|nr:hypothetical protein [Deltaproteobacteria bacterium]
MRALPFACAAVVATTCTPPAPPPAGMDSSVLVDERGLSTALICPGATGCANAEGPLRAGAATRAITPPVGEDQPPVWMAGFDIGRQATGMHDEQWARALIIERGDTAVGVVVLDLIGLFHDEVQRVRAAAQDAGLDLDTVFVVTTHVHEVKDTMGMWGSSVGDSGIDPPYMQLIVDQSVAALTDARAALTPVSMRVGRGDASPWVRDSRQPIVLDPTVTALDFVDDTGASRATLVVWGNHPEALGSDNTLLTSDYPHYLRTEIEERLPGTVAIFAPGLLGGLTTTIGLSVCPDGAGVDTCPQGSFERAERIGREVGQIAAEALTDAPLVAGALAFRRLGTFLTPTTTPLALAFQLGMIQRAVWDEDGERIPEDQIEFLSIDEVIAGKIRVGTELSTLSLGDVELTAIPGELYSELWLANEDGSSRVERPEGGDLPSAEPEPAFSGLVRAAPVSVVLNNANDALGYVIPAPQWDVDEPFAYDPEGQYGEQNSLGSGTAPALVEALRALAALRLP